MQDAARRKRRIAVWLASAVVFSSIVIATFEHLWSRFHSPLDPLGAGLAAYQRHDWLEAGRLARVRLKTQHHDADASRLLARAASS